MVLLMSAIVATTTTAILHLIANSQTEISSTAAKYGQISLATDMSNTVQLRESCNLTLTTTGFNPAGETPAQLVWNVADDPVGRPQRIDLNTNVPDYNIIVKSLNIKSVTRIGSLTPTRTLYSGSLVMDSQSMAVATAYKPLKVADMYFEVEGSTVINCYGMSEIIQLSQSACEAIGAELNSDNSCSLKPNLPVTRCPSGRFIQGFGAGFRANCVAN
jgi:hypothetical protein